MYGISLALPGGWIAAILQGELYGIEPLSRNDGRIYVTCRIANVGDVVQIKGEEIDLGFLRLRPTSSPVVEKNKVSVHGVVEGVGSHRYAYCTTVITEKNKAISFIALFEESAVLYYKGAANQISASVEDLL